MILDYPNNPFYVPTFGVPEGRTTTWSNDEVANTVVLDKIRSKIEGLEFKRKHLPLMFDQQELLRFIDGIEQELIQWKFRLDQARYN